MGESPAQYASKQTNDKQIILQSLSDTMLLYILYIPVNIITTFQFLCIATDRLYSFINPV